jgi:hypothetical protein
MNDTTDSEPYALVAVEIPPDWKANPSLSRLDDFLFRVKRLEDQAKGLTKIGSNIWQIRLSSDSQLLGALTQAASDADVCIYTLILNKEPQWKKLEPPVGKKSSFKPVC